MLKTQQQSVVQKTEVYAFVASVLLYYFTSSKTLPNTSSSLTATIIIIFSVYSGLENIRQIFHEYLLSKEQMFSAST